MVAQDLCHVAQYEEWNELVARFKFDFGKTTKILLKNHDLLHEVELSSLIDGATLTRSLVFAAAGVKLIDVVCKCPVSKVHLNLPTMDSCLVQSKERCFQYEIVLQKMILTHAKYLILLHL